MIRLEAKQEKARYEGRTKERKGGRREERTEKEEKRRKERKKNEKKDETRNLISSTFVRKCARRKPRKNAKVKNQRAILDDPYFFRK